MRNTPYLSAILVRRLNYLYDDPFVAQIATELADLRANDQDAEAEALKTRYTRRMYNLSAFVKTLKQGFSDCPSPFYPRGT